MTVPGVHFDIIAAKTAQRKQKKYHGKSRQCCHVGQRAAGLTKANLL